MIEDFVLADYVAELQDRLTRQQNRTFIGSSDEECDFADGKYAQLYEIIEDLKEYL